MGVEGWSAIEKFELTIGSARLRAGRRLVPEWLTKKSAWIGNVVRARFIAIERFLCG